MSGGVREGAHLVARFFDVLSARHLRPSEQFEVSQWLDSATEQRLFWDQPVADQRHGLGAARHVAAHRPDRRDLIRAALLHDIGKRHARLGVLGRSLATVWGSLGLAGTSRMRLYREHGRIGADELAAAGVESVVVEFTRSHHGPAPPSFDSDDWALLEDADRVRR